MNASDPMSDPSPVSQPLVDSAPCPIIDMHTHIWEHTPGGGSAEDERTIVDMADRFGLEAVVVMPLFGGLCPTRRDIEAANEAVAALARRDPRIRPMVYVNPRIEGHALEQVNRWMDDGFEGLKIWVNFADDACVFPLIERMIEIGKPTLIHAMHKSVGQLPLESDPRNIAALARLYPEARLIMPHMGGNFLYSCEVIEPYPNVWTDPSGTYCETGMLEHAVSVLGPNRIMFGSDAPGADFMNNLAKVVAADLPESTLRQILCENARELWGWA